MEGITNKAMQCMRIDKSPKHQILAPERKKERGQDWEVDEIRLINDDNRSSVWDGIVGWPWINSLDVDGSVLLHGQGRWREARRWSSVFVLAEAYQGKGGSLLVK